MGIYIAIGAVLIAAIFLIRKNRKEEAESEDAFIVDTVEDQVSTPVIEVENKVEKVVETVEQAKERLKSIVNPDSDKPFAKISVPDVAEAASVPTEAPKAKAPRKPRAPKVAKVEAPKAEETKSETAEPKAKRVYKKRAKK